MLIHAAGNKKHYFFQIQSTVAQPGTALVQVMPDDHSNSVPPLPIPNRTVKRDYADDSAATSVKVGYRQASYRKKPRRNVGFFFVPRKVREKPADNALRAHPTCP